MNIAGKIIIKLVSLLFLVSLPIFVLSQTNNVQIQFVHVVGNRDLVYDSAIYKNELNQDFTISNFKYYVGKISFIDESGKSSKPSDYIFINQDDEETKNSAFSLENGFYKGIEFNIGVDSVDNQNGVHSGALDVLNAMYWTWNSGFIFMKLEGNSSYSTSPAHFFEYHIGGYKFPTNSIRKVKINFTEPLIVDRGNKVSIQLNVDVLEILKSPNTIDFSKLSSVVEPSTAKVIADNYSDIFTIKSIEVIK